MTYSEIMHRSMRVRQARNAVATAAYWRQLGNRKEATWWLSYAAGMRSTLYVHN